MTPGWFPSFLAAVGWATLASARLVPKRDVGGYFHRFTALCALLCAGAAGAMLPVGPAMAFPVATVLAALAAWVGGRSERELPILNAVVAMPVAALAATATPLWAAAHVLLAGAVAGAVLTAMLLGHWYLVNARLPFALLIRLCRLTLALVVVRAAFSAALACGAAGTAPAWDRVAEFYRQGQMFEFLMPVVRVAAGIGLGAALAAMALSCAKIKSNQSATGILYVAVGILLIGEMAGLYLTFGAGVPL